MVNYNQLTLHQYIKRVSFKGRISLHYSKECLWEISKRYVEFLVVTVGEKKLTARRLVDGVYIHLLSLMSLSKKGDFASAKVMFWLVQTYNHGASSTETPEMHQGRYIYIYT